VFYNTAVELVKLLGIIVGKREGRLAILVIFSIYVSINTRDDRSTVEKTGNVDVGGGTEENDKTGGRWARERMGTGKRKKNLSFVRAIDYSQPPTKR